MVFLTYHLEIEKKQDQDEDVEGKEEEGLFGEHCF